MIQKILSGRTIATVLRSSQASILYNHIPKNINTKTHALFSSNEKLPKNKEEAWIMQEQKNLKKTNLQDQQQNEQYKGVTKVGIAGIVVAISSLLYMLYNASQKSQENLAVLEEDISGLVEKKQRENTIGGDWTLVDTEGRGFSSRNLSGYYYLAYFGFSKCPDICPSALYSISSIYRIIRNLPEGAYLKLKIVFISVDPERDTPAVLKQFLKHFGKQIIGVTALKGDERQLKECMKKFGIQAKKFDYEQCQKRHKDDYNMDHTTRVFLMDPDNTYLYDLDPTLTEQQSAKAIVAKIVQNEHRRTKMEQQFNQK